MVVRNACGERRLAPGAHQALPAAHIAVSVGWLGEADAPADSASASAPASWEAPPCIGGTLETGGKEER